MATDFAKTLVLSQVILALKEALGRDLISVVLFGSQAREDAKPESDWDLLMIGRQFPQKHLKRYQYLKTILPASLRGNVSILAKTPAEFENSFPSLYLDIALDGVILYDPNQYAFRKLDLLKKIIAQKGLQRTQVNDDFVWLWQQFPGFNWSLEWESMQP